MERDHNELRVGISVLAALIFLVAGIMYMKGCSLRVRQYDITVVFDNVQGLEVGANVLANGVEKGRVHDIRLGAGRVFVDASIDKDVKLFSDYRIIVDAPTLLAGKVLSIYPGGIPPLANTDTILIGSATLGMAEAVEIFQGISGDLKLTIRNLNNVLVSMNEVVGDSTNQAHIAGTLANAHEATRLSTEWLKENRATLTMTLDRVEGTFAQAESLLAVTGPQLQATIGDVDSAMVQINEVSASLHRILNNLESGESTAGKLLKDDELYLRLNHVLANVDSLASEVRGHGLKMRHTLKIF